jgi:hypothetical protein
MIVPLQLALKREVGERGAGGTVYSLFLRTSHTRGAETRIL